MVQYALISKRPCALQDRAIRLARDGGTCLLLRQSKSRFHLVVEIPLVVASAPGHTPPLVR